MEHTILLFTALSAVVLAKNAAERAGITSTCLCKREGYQVVFHASQSTLEQAFFNTRF